MSLRRRSLKSEWFLDMTPCSDIMFTLLLFYILTQSFVTQLPLQLPRIQTGEPTLGTREVHVQIDRDGKVKVGEKWIASPWRESLPGALPASCPTVLLLTHREAPAGVAVELLDALRHLGVTSLSFGGLPLTETIE